MQRHRLMVFFSVVIMASMVLAACAQPVPVEPGGETTTTQDVVVIGMSQEPDSLYGITASMAVQRQVAYAIREPFHTERDYSYQVNPNLFESLPTLENGGATLDDGGTSDDPSDDQLTMIYKIQPGLKWSDGEPLTAHDFVYANVTVGADPESGAVSYAAWEKIETYEALDDLTLRVVLKKGILDPEYFLYYDPFGLRGPLPKHAWEQYAPRELIELEQVTRLSSPSYGPYMVDEWVPQDYIRLVANPHYYGAAEGKPYIKTVVFRIIPNINQLVAQLASGDIDVATSDALQATQAPLLEQFEAEGLIKVYWMSSPTWEHLDMNTNAPASVNSDQQNLSEPHFALGDVRVRQAIAYGTDRQAMVDNIYAGKSSVMHTFIPPSGWAYAGDENITIYAYDPDQARALLDEAGWVPGADGIREKDGRRLSLKVNFTAGNAMRERFAQLFQQNMRQIGIEIIIDPLPASVWFAADGPLYRREYDLGEFAWVGETDPGGETLYRCDMIPMPSNNWSGQNTMGWCNETADAAIRAANNTLIQQERIDAYRIVQQEFTKDMVSLPLFNRLEIYASRPNVQNVAPNPTEYVTWNVAEWQTTGN